MKLKLVIYPNKGSNRFKSTSVGAFISEKNYQKLRSDIGLKSSDVLFAKISCNEILSKFSVFHQIDEISINAQEKGDEACIHIHKDIIGDVLDSGNLSIEVDPIKLEALPLATKVIIELQKKEVATWSKEEANQAVNTISTKNQFLQKNQVLLVNPITKDKVKGIVRNIASNDTDTLGMGIYRLDYQDTEIALEGLPQDAQKVLEFNKIGGLGNTISRLREIIQLPLNYPEVFERFDIKPYRGILLYGPPGNGKTMIARALAKSLGAKFFPIEGPELMSKHVSIGERELRGKFIEAEESGNSIIFIDELDSIAVNRNDDSQDYEIRFVSTLLNLMDGMRSNSGVVIMGATNRVHAIDPAFRRPGRFDLDFEIPLPDAAGRLEIFKIYAKLEKGVFDKEIDDIYLKQLCDKAEGFAGADLAGVYRESVMNAVRRHLVFDDLGKSSFNIEPLTIAIKKEDLELAFGNFKSHIKRVLEIE
jgi:ATP-dependent 26S proteasome regulatory subunit